MDVFGGPLLYPPLMITIKVVTGGQTQRIYGCTGYGAGSKISKGRLLNLWSEYVVVPFSDKYHLVRVHYKRFDFRGRIKAGDKHFEEFRFKLFGLVLNMFHSALYFACHNTSK